MPVQEITDFPTIPVQKNMTWHFREYKAEGPLANYIDCFWSENFMDNNPQKRLLVFPDNTVELIFCQAPLIRNGHSYLSHLSGLKTRSQIVDAERSPLVAVRFKPYGIKPFITCSPQELLNGCFLPEDVFGSEIKHIEEQLFESKEFESRVNILHQYFCKKLAGAKEPLNLFGPNITQFISAHNGGCTIPDLLNWSGLSLKSLERHFKKHFGLSPKQYLRLQRVLLALATCRAKPESSLTSIAYSFGYFDQAHFINEVKKFTGLNPLKFRRELSDLQALIFHQ